MNDRTHRSVTMRRGALAVTLLAMTIGGYGLAWAQTTSAPTDDDRLAAILARSETMIGEMRAMQAEVMELDLALDGKVAEMYAASEDHRLEATQAVVEELVTQRKIMRDHMKGSHQQLMMHMMEVLLIEDAELRERALKQSPVMRMILPPHESGGTGAVGYGEPEQ